MHDRLQPLDYKTIAQVMREAIIRKREHLVLPDLPFFEPIKWEADWSESELNYVELLPSFKGKRVVEVIKELILTTADSPSVLVVECENGSALEECRYMWNRKTEKLRLFGLTAGKIEAKQRQSLKEQGLVVYCDDPHSLSAVFEPKEAFDLVLCAKLGTQVDQLEVVNQVWQVLSPGGIALLGGGRWPDERLNQLSLLNAYFKKKNLGITFEIASGRFNNNLRPFSVVMENINGAISDLAFPLEPESLVPSGWGLGQTLIYS